MVADIQFGELEFQLIIIINSALPTLCLLQANILMNQSVPNVGSQEKLGLVQA